MARNIKDLLMGATQFPAAIEARLPAGAPKISMMLVDATGRIPAVPDFPIEIPDLPAPPMLPMLPVLPEFPAAGGLRRYVTGVEERPVTEVIIPSPAVGVIPEVQSRRGL